MLRKTSYIVISLFVAFCLISKASAEENFRALTVADGMADLTVNVVYKDSLGYVWLGTSKSVDRFDGAHFMNYLIPGNNEHLKYVNAIAEMSRNEIWVGNGMGLWRVDKVKRQLIRIAEETINFPVNALLHDGHNTLYIASRQGLFSYHDGILDRLLIDPNIISVSNDITGISLDDNELWLTTSGGLYRINLLDKSVDKLSDGSFNRISRIGDKLYLGTTDSGIKQFDILTSELSDLIDLGCNVISSLSTDGQSMLYVGTDGGGAFFIDAAGEKVVKSFRHESSNPESLRSNAVRSLLVDRDGLTWIGFYQSGLQYTIFQDDLFSVYSYPPHFNSKDMPVRALSVRGSEMVVGTRDGLFFIDETKHRFRSFGTPQMRSNMVFCCQYYQGEYYVGTYGGGMYILNPVTLSLRDFSRTNEMPFSRGHVFCAAVDTDGQLWIGTSMGVYCYEGSRMKYHFDSGNSKLPEGNIYEIFFDSTRKGWICAETGMALWDPSTCLLRVDTFPEGFIHNEKVRVVFEDSDHLLYFMPDRGAMLISDISMTSFHRLQPDTPLDGLDGLFITEDKARNLWIGTTGGLFRYDKLDSFIPYGFADGLPSPIFTLCPPADDGNGGLWLGNTKGLIHLDAQYVNAEKPLIGYDLTVTDVLVNGESTVFPEAYRTGITLAPAQKNVSFRISDFSFTEPSYMSFEYMLEGYDSGWSTLKGKPEKTYYDLPPGSYTFRVRRTGLFNTETVMAVHATYALSWQTIGLTLAVLIAVGLVVIILRRRSNAVTVNASDRKGLFTPPYTQNADIQAIDDADGERPKYKTVNISEDECTQLASRIDEIMQTQKLYLRQDLKLADLANAAGVSVHTLSYVFNQHLSRNYYDYVNDYRVQEFKRMAATADMSRYTLSGLAEECGFSSRASFFRYFKKAEGVTPNEYLNKLKSSN